jgi:hypothetical protein
MRESDIERAIHEELNIRGFTCLHTSSHIRGKPASYATGVDKGVPDLIVTHRSWPIGVWLGVEVKTVTGRLRPEQLNLLNEGRIIVAREPQSAVDAVLIAHNALAGRRYQ